MTTLSRLLSTSLLASSLFVVATAHAADKPAAPKKPTEDVGEIIVTGVFSAKSIENAPISISAVTAKEISQQVPVSAADLLKNVPGVFVNSGLGEIRNVVFSRGISANSLDGASGYFYVSLQEDGLPVETNTSTNFGPDYFARTDIMLDHLEALRGGTATVTGANAPGGIFNYISRNGKNHPGYEVQGKFGLEGDGKNPYYRADGYAGGRIGDSNLYYAVGGFYRASRGARYPGYDLNKGGQIRANVLWEYGKGKLQIDGKYLNDHNGWFEFLPATNFNSPTIATGFSNTDSVLPPSNPHSYINPDGSKGSWNGSNLVHSRTYSVGATWDHDVTENIHVQNRARLTRNEADWNSGAVIFAVPLDDFAIALLNGTFGIPGVTTYRNHATGQIVGQVQSFSGFDHSVIPGSINLPNQNVLTNGVLTQVALDQSFRTTEFQDQFTVNATFGRNQLSAGAYFAHSNQIQTGGSGGIGISGLTGRPQVFDVTHTTPDGTVLRVTDPAGFASEGGGIFDGSGNHGTQRQISFFAGDSFNVTDQLTVEGGLRYENIKYDITTKVLGPSISQTGDGNPLTLWDNRINTYLTSFNNVQSFNLFNFTGAVNYKVNDHFQTYVRYTRGHKAQDFGLIQSETTHTSVTPQTIQQIEMGLKYHAGPVRLALFPFYSKLSNVSDQQVFIDANAHSYNPPAVFGTVKTYGVEFSGDADLGEKLNVRTAITIQSPKSSGFGFYIQGPKKDRTDDFLGPPTPSGDADNNPKLILRSTVTYRPVKEAQIFFTHNYLGSRAANRNNAWYMPGFHTVDFGASYEFAGKLKFQFNVNNLFNQLGVVSWAKSGGFFASLDRQALTKADVAGTPGQLFSIVPNQPRSFWLTTTLKF